MRIDEVFNVRLYSGRLRADAPRAGAPGSICSATPTVRITKPSEIWGRITACAVFGSRWYNRCYLQQRHFVQSSEIACPHRTRDHPFSAMVRYIILREGDGARPTKSEKRRNRRVRDAARLARVGKPIRSGADDILR